jgi:hypothetical protein
LPAILCIPLEKQFQKYMGSKKDEKYRIHILDIGIIVDLKEMITYGTQEF